MDLATRRLTLADGDEEGFDELLLATGACTTPPPIPGIEEAQPPRLGPPVRRRRRLTGRRCRRDRRRYVALGIAEAFMRQGRRTTLSSTRSSARWTPTWPRAQEGRGLGIDTQIKTQVEEVLLDGDGRSRPVRTDRGEVPARHVVVATGIKPNVGVAEAAGLTVGASGALGHRGLLGVPPPPARPRGEHPARHPPQQAEARRRDEPDRR